MEYLDIFNENYEFIGSEPREKAHKNGLWHHTFQCWLAFKKTDGIYIIFQKRQETKQTFPSCLDITAAGHIISGESAEDGVREIEEELGLDIKFDDLLPIGIITQELKGKDFIDNEFCHVFIYIKDFSLEDFIIQKEEVAGIFILNLDETEKVLKDVQLTVTGYGFEVNNLGNQLNINKTFSKKDFVPHNNDYYDKVFCAIRNQIEK